MGVMKTPFQAPTDIITEAATFVGIDFHKLYSVYRAIDAADETAPHP